MQLCWALMPPRVPNKAGQGVACKWGWLAAAAAPPPQPLPSQLPNTAASLPHPPLCFSCSHPNGEPAAGNGVMVPARRTHLWSRRRSIQGSCKLRPCPCGAPGVLSMPPHLPFPPPGFPNDKTGSLFTAILHIFWCCCAFQKIGGCSAGQGRASLHPRRPVPPRRPRAPPALRAPQGVPACTTRSASPPLFPVRCSAVVGAGVLALPRVIAWLGWCATRAVQHCCHAGLAGLSQPGRPLHSTAQQLLQSHPLAPPQGGG